MKTKKAMGGADTTQNLTFVSNSGVDAAYTAAAATMDSHDTELVSNKTAGVYYSTYTGTVSGVTFVGKYGHIDGKSYSYLYFVMKAGDRLIDCSQDKVCIYNTTESDLATDTQAFLDGIAAAMLL